MKFQTQMIHVPYDHAAEVLYLLQYDPEISSVTSLSNEKVYLYRAVYHDYQYQSIMADRKDFFSDSKYYETEITRISIEVQLAGGLAEQNVILYHVNTIIDYVVKYLRQCKQKGIDYANIGYIGVDLNKKQLVITDIQTKCNAYYQIVIDRDINHVYGAGSGFQYFIRFRFIKRQEE